MALADTITAGVAATKRRLLAGGLLREVEWGVVVPVVLPAVPDPRGRKVYAYTTIDALIEQRPEIDRGRFSTERSDDIKLIVLDQLSITDEDLFRFGEPLHTYSVKKIDGVISDEELGTRYASEVTVIR